MTSPDPLGSAPTPPEAGPAGDRRGLPPVGLGDAKGRYEPSGAGPTKPPRAPCKPLNPARVIDYALRKMRQRFLEANMPCDAKIRPFPNPTEVGCERTDAHTEHRGVLRDYAYPGSTTEITWQESDRRTFRGLYVPCGDNDFPCILPHHHRGNHAL